MQELLRVVYPDGRMVQIPAIKKWRGFPDDVLASVLRLFENSSR